MNANEPLIERAHQDLSIANGFNVIAYLIMALRHAEVSMCAYGAHSAQMTQ